MLYFGRLKTRGRTNHRTQRNISFQPVSYDPLSGLSLSTWQRIFWKEKAAGTSPQMKQNIHKQQLFWHVEERKA